MPYIINSDRDMSDLQNTAILECRKKLNWKSTTRFFFNKQHFYKPQQTEVGKIIKQKLSNNLMLKSCYLEIMRFLYSCYHPKLICDILRDVKKTSVWLNEIVWLITMKMRLEKKNGSQRYDINRSRWRHGHKYTIYKMCLSMMVAMCNKQHLNDIGSWFHRKVN